MKKLIKNLFIFFVLFLIIASVVGYYVYQNRGKELPMESVIQERITKKVMPELFVVADTLITPEQAMIKDISQKEKMLEIQQQNFLQERQEVAQIKDSLSIFKNRVNELLAKKEMEANEKIDKLAKIYQNMDPAEVAPIIEELDNNTAVKILSKMRERQVAQVLENMNKDRAIELTRAMTFF